MVTANGSLLTLPRLVLNSTYSIQQRPMPSAAGVMSIANAPVSLAGIL